ncbi:MAG: hypothetical protein EP329_21375 [Deltaproteobacteria bacterium]|nr:MAG: hypothetical protein EP329_21375 [Deltaproteobacteria bacterium]
MSLLLATTLLLTQIGAAPEADASRVDLAGLAACEDSLDVAIFNAPRRPSATEKLRVLIVSERELDDARVLALDPAGATHELPAEARGGPPWGWIGEVDAPTRGKWRFALVSGGGVAACQDVLVRPRPSGSNDPDEEGRVWRSRIKWERDTENLYSLWVERLFDAPIDQDVSWNPLSEVLSDPARNLLYNYMGLGEDAGAEGAPRMDPDCADFPYFLRSYFAWKLGLPFAFRPCRRGNAKRAPTCGEPNDNHMPAEGDTRLAAYARFVRKIAATVHSSSLRSLPDDERSDFYPVALNRHGLRPGAIYTDPYGHTMMVGRWYPQTDGRAGVLMAIDAQPDGTIGRRVFWRGSFMFPADDALKGAGWKRFRPVRKEKDGTLLELSNAEIAASIDYGDFSVEQWSRGKDGFYEMMDAVINPHPMPPEEALLATVDALDQQVRRRVESVENGEQWKREHPGKTMTMPEGADIFITSGPWEDYSTPSRDMRILIAIDTVKAFPARLQAHPERFALAEGEDPAAAAERLVAKLKEETERRTIQYRRSDGSMWTLTLAAVMARTEALEMGYNPNDCIEIRWGAPEGSDERSTCRDGAPDAQRKLMAETFRPWFQSRERPIY